MALASALALILGSGSVLAAGRGGGGAGGLGWARSGFSGADGGLNRGAGVPAEGWSPSLPLPSRPTLNPPPARPAAVAPAAATSNPGAAPSPSPGLAGGTPGTPDPLTLRPLWLRSGWAQARPWPWGWYGLNVTPSWTWWSARSARWGVSGLASAALLREAVSAVIAAEAPTLVVPASGGQLQLVLGTVQPLGPASLSFLALGPGGGLALNGDCQAGLLNGQIPASLAEAELLHAACLVAFGPA